MSSSLEDLIASRVDALPKGLREHTRRVQRIALELAHRHEVDEEKVRLGTLAHDVARAMKGDQLLLKAGSWGYPSTPWKKRRPCFFTGRWPPSC